MTPRVFQWSMSVSPIALIAFTSKMETYPSSPQEKRICLFPIMTNLMLLTCFVWWFKSWRSYKCFKSQIRILQSFPAEIMNLLHRDIVRSIITSLCPWRTPWRLPFVTLQTLTSLNLKKLTCRRIPSQRIKMFCQSKRRKWRQGFHLEALHDHN